jgi:hypothetical protein
VAGRDGQAAHEVKVLRCFSISSAAASAFPGAEGGQQPHRAPVWSPRPAAFHVCQRPDTEPGALRKLLLTETRRQPLCQPECRKLCRSVFLVISRRAQEATQYEVGAIDLTARASIGRSA